LERPRQGQIRGGSGKIKRKKNSNTKTSSNTAASENHKSNPQGGFFFVRKTNFD
jgi:hypothetical protein